MRLRAVTLIVAALDAAAALAVTAAMLWSHSDPATKGLDTFAGYAVALLFLLTGVPALALTWYRRAPQLALTLALAFPAAFLVLLIIAIFAVA
jgi:hypothetical protein